MANRCCFAGHSNINDAHIIEKITEVALDLINNKDVTEFWVGHYGDFDHYAASAIRTLKKRYTNIKLELVLPYLTKGINEYPSLYNDKFDTLLMADIPEKTPHKFKITKANEYMVNNSDYLIAYVKYSWGGAAKTLQYAKRKNCSIRTINIATCD